MGKGSVRAWLPPRTLGASFHMVIACRPQLQNLGCFPPTLLCHTLLLPAKWLWTLWMGAEGRETGERGGPWENCLRQGWL